MTELAPHVLATILLATQRTTRRLLVELATTADEVSRAAERSGS